MISNSAEPLCVSPGEQVLIEGLCSSAWYRLLRRAFWIWQGAEPIEIEDRITSYNVCYTKLLRHHHRRLQRMCPKQPQLAR